MASGKKLKSVWLLFVVCGALAAVCGDVGLPRTSAFLTLAAGAHLILFLIGFLT